ncbi:hypothetical protein CDO52_15905 [Nocardiopsis gilva YIM 90087]|uniref:DUF4158 domain-containing protein n=1 Tax=Nocardiopsis gilva YIM 90087 TaxID=1235441 RepID=A0A223S7I1_9ACTN|nr:DUF4158 domain-containing protein [Nocardiopsis gilva]ASU84073.1 hypothetical protein CDO52_15905 [Nocardiopsis gilva YIM 90087]
MRQRWTPEELDEHWSLKPSDRKLLGNKSGATRLGFALILKFFQLEKYFPTCGEEIPDPAVAHIAAQVEVETAMFGKVPVGDAGGALPSRPDPPDLRHARAQYSANHPLIFGLPFSATMQ